MDFVFSTNKVVGVFVFGILALNCFFRFGSNAQLLPEDEVNTLEKISRKLQLNRFWNNISRSFCESVGLNTTLEGDISRESNITCACSISINGSVCHVRSIRLKSLDLEGALPEEFGDLTHLEELDLSRNFIVGSIPPDLSRAPLRYLSILGNQLTGSIPAEIGEITTLTDLVLENNFLDGPLPPELGSLKNLQRLLLAANNFRGTIPETYGNLKNLTDFRIDGTRISGRIPSFIGNYTKLRRLDMQGTSMEGPIPSTISLLRNLTELRISDLWGSTIPFPNLADLKLLQRLVLRNCLIDDSIPSYIGEMADLKLLDLSFNRLRGEIPLQLQSLTKLDYMFLTNNSLTGEVPSWISSAKEDFDLSYNNFTRSTDQLSCTNLSPNLISSYSSSEARLWCLKKELRCSGKPLQDYLFINCGGPGLEFEGNHYAGDTQIGGPAAFFSSAEKWGFSSTGVFMGDDRRSFIAQEETQNQTKSEIYQTARLSPISLKYYGLCMRNGSYKVQLHFSEIMFSNGQTFRSLGRRVFNVSIQGKLVSPDFNIMEEAGGARISITRTFENVIVSGSTLEIHLYWAGKGTSAFPERGVYGPLISAITVTPTITVTPNNKVNNRDRLSVGAIAGIVVASCVLVVFILLALLVKGYLGGRDIEDPELRALELQTGYFSLRHIKAATGDFDPANKIGEGGFGPVYKVYYQMVV